MLCATCVSIFQGPSKQGVHHVNFGNLVKAATNGCKICIFLYRFRDDRGADESGRENMQPFTTFRFHYFSTAELGWGILFYSPVSWITTKRVDFVQFHVSQPGQMPNWWPGFLRQVNHDLLSEPWRVRSDKFPSRFIPANTGDIEVARLGLEWLNACILHHATCDEINGPRDLTVYPQRLLDVGTSDSRICRLIITQFEQPPAGSRYATLSHCWGRNPSFKTLTSENITKLQENIPSEWLPKSFVESIQTCRRLGIQYLWIDSLCIIQSGPGSEEDWQAHAAVMDVIYTNCVLNIAIDDASNPDQGAFTDRDSAFIQTAFVYAPSSMEFHTPIYPHQSELPSHTDEEGSVKSRNDSEKYNKSTGQGDGTSSLVTLFTFHDDSQSYLWSVYHPLQSRGWVFQERLMAPRTLHFGKDMIHWECNEKSLGEYLPWGLPGSGDAFHAASSRPFNLPHVATQPKDPTELTSEAIADLHDVWFRCVDDYSGTDLTYPEKDKLTAIAAIAKRIGRIIPGSYCAGLFESSLPQGLLWVQRLSGVKYYIRGTDLSITISLDSDRDPVYRAPSWSWASVDGGVGFTRHVTGRTHIMAKLESTSVELREPYNPYGQVLSGDIVIRGHILHLLPSQLRLEYGWQAFEGYLEKYESCGGLFTLCIMQGPRDVVAYPDGRGLIPGVFGILLARLDPDIFQRVGYFEIAAYHSLPDIIKESEQRRVKII